MGETSIEWTDKSWNPTRGCRRISPGCENCYAETMAARFCGEGQPFEGLIQLGKHGPRWNGAGRFVPGKLEEPLHWRKPARVFVNSMSDLFFEEFSDEQIASVFGVMAACPQHTFQVLTKRPEHALEWFARTNLPDPRGGYFESTERQIEGHFMAHKMIGVQAGPRLRKERREFAWPLPNVHIGVSVENQHYADERIPLLLQLPAAVRFISYEPALGPVDWSAWMGTYSCFSCDYRGFEVRHSDADDREQCPRCGTVAGDGFGMAENDPRFRGLAIDWIIVGGESGSSARPFDIAWARSTVQQSKAAGVPVFVKQLGSRPIVHHASEWPGARFDVAEQHVKLLDRKGGDMTEWPADLRVREIPSAA